MANIRLATAGDAAAIAAIYAPYCEATVSLVRGDGAELPRRWRGVSPRSEPRGRGSCSKTMAASSGTRMRRPHHERAAYRWSVSTAIYIGRDASAARRGPRACIRRCSRCSAPSATARPPQESRCRIPPASGCTPRLASSRLAYIVDIGYKMGGWHDVGWYQAEIQPLSAHPADPRSIREIVDTPEWRDAVAQGLAHYLRDMNHFVRVFVFRRWRWSALHGSALLNSRRFLLSKPPFQTCRPRWRSGASRLAASSSNISIALRSTKTG